MAVSEHTYGEIQKLGRCSNGALTLGTLVLIAIGIAATIFGSAYSIYFRVPFPFQDMVEIMEFLDVNTAIWLGKSFTRLHDMEHRPALPALIWYADRLLSGSSGLIPLLVGHGALAATALIAVRNWTPRIGLKQPTTWLLPVASLGLMFSLINWYNLTWEKQLHVAMSLLFLTLSAHFAAQLSPSDDGDVRPGDGRNLLFSALAAWAATFSFGYGLPVMAVITIHGMLGRWPRRCIAFSAIVSLIFMGAYSYFFSLGGRSLIGTTPVTWDPVEMIAYVARLLAGAVAGTELHHLAGVDRSTPALIAGLALLGLYVFGAGRLYLRSLQFAEPPRRSHSGSLIVTTVCVAIALMTWLSRSNETQGLVTRYYIVSTLFMLSLPGLFVSANAWTQNKSARAQIGLVGLSFAFIVFSVLGHLANYTQPYLRWHASAVAAIAADMGIYLDEQDRLIGPQLHQWQSKTAAVWEAHRQRLKQRGRYDPFEWRGRNVSAVFDALLEEGCFGSIERMEAVPGYRGEYVFIGWARHGAMATANANWILATDAKGRIIGLGAPGRPSANGRNWLKPDFPGQTGFFANHSGIAGYLSAAPGTIVRLFTVKGQNACEFAVGSIPH